MISKVISKHFCSLILMVLFLVSICSAQVDGQKINALKKLSLFVTDKDGNLVTGIQKEDIDLKINGKEILDFSLENETAPLLYVLAMDNSGSMRLVLENIITSAKKIVEQNSSNDGTVLMRFVDDKTIQVTEKFTSDKNYLYRTLDNFYIQGGKTALIDAIYKSVEIVAGQKGVGKEYRRSVIIISDGEDRDSFRKQEELFELIEKENVQIFFVGLIGNLDEMGGMIRRSPKQKAKKFVEELVKLSGGVAIFPKKSADVVNFADKIVPLMREQQFIKFETSEEIKDSDIKVKLAKTSKKKKLDFFTHLIN